MNKPLFEFVKVRFGNRELYSYQLELLKGLLERKRVVASMARQSGKSEAISIGVVIEAMRTPNGHIIIVAPTDRQAGELFLKVAYYLKLDGIAQTVESLTARTATLNNGCRISAFPVGNDGDNLRGMTASMLIMEEASFIKDDIVNEVLMPMISTPGSKLIKISTPRGKNHFYKSFVSDAYTSFRYTWEDAVSVGRYNKEFIDEARSNATEIQFKVEYEAEFVEGTDNYFPSKLIDMCVDTNIDQEYVPKSNHIYFMGVDVAYAGKDKSVFTILETDKTYGYGKVVHIFEYETNTTGSAFDKACELQDKWGFNKIFTDATTAGSGLAEMLRRKYNVSTAKKSKSDIVEGVIFTNKSKIDMFSNLKIHMEHDNIRIPNNSNLVYQLQDFRYELSTKSDAVKLHHSAGGHDDYPDSLALACLGIKKDKLPVMFDFNTTDKKSEQFKHMDNKEYETYNKPLEDMTVYKFEGQKMSKEEYDKKVGNEDDSLLF